MSFFYESIRFYFWVEKIEQVFYFRITLINIGEQMKFSFIDFLIGFFAANSIPHFVIGICKIRFLSLFGYTPMANIFYSVLCFLMSLGLFHFEYGISSILNYSLYVGVLTVLVGYFVSCKFLYEAWKK